MLDFKSISAAALAQAEQLVGNWLPNGRLEGQEWVALNPRRHDRNLGSFKVNLKSGVWKDFASGDSGSDLISLNAFLMDTGQGRAAQALKSELGLLENPTSAKPGPRHVPVVKKPLRATRSLHSTVPNGTPDPDFYHPQYGHPATVWIYHDQNGCRIFFICRFETPAGKEIRPLSWGNCRWLWKASPSPKPLFNLHLLEGCPESVVIVTEGEKAADACRSLFLDTNDAIVTTWAGGCCSWRKTDWTILSGRRVIIWPDNDDPGKKVADQIRFHLVNSVSAEAVRIIKIPDSYPYGWDAHDAMEEGWSSGDVINLMKGK